MNIQTLIATTICGLGLANAGMAQDLPAEFPPADFVETQYIDSEGCAFIRAGISGVVNWIPRMNRQREPLCGFTPSFASETAVVAPEIVASNDAPIINVAPVAVPIIDLDAETLTTAAHTTTTAAEGATTIEAAAQPVAIASAQTARVSAPPIVEPGLPPIATVAGSGPTVLPVSPQIISIPAAGPVVAPTATAPRQITFAAACAGRSGILPGHVTPEGSPVDCGPATTAAVIAVAPQSPAPRRVTLAEICAEIAATGRTVIDQATGDPVACANAGALPQGSGRSANELAIASMIAPTAPPATFAFLSGSSRSSRGSNIPASNPVSAPQPRPTPGYADVWGDGRVNSQRGLPSTGHATTTNAPAAAPAAVAHAVTPSAAVSGHRYVQVGSFGNAANATRTLQRLQGLGLPTGVANVTRNGQSLQVVAAGPFANASDLNRALQAARALGFGDAFTRQ